MSLNFNEVGEIIRVNVGKDISASTPTLILRPEVGQQKEISTGVTIPNVQVVTDAETFEANEYIQYTTVVDDLNYVGRWKKKARLDFSPSNIEQTDFVKFRVLP
jgi:hypothetical protein